MCLRSSLDCKCSIISAVLVDGANDEMWMDLIMFVFTVIFGSGADFDGRSTIKSARVGRLSSNFGCFCSGPDPGDDGVKTRLRPATNFEPSIAVADDVVAPTFRPNGDSVFKGDVCGVDV